MVHFDSDYCTVRSMMFFQQNYVCITTFYWAYVLGCAWTSGPKRFKERSVRIVRPVRACFVLLCLPRNFSSWFSRK